MLLLSAPIVVAETAAPPCKRFEEIYASGKELCENMWNDAFVYETDESKAYTMWFFEKTNPNDVVSRDLGLLTDKHDVCHLDYYHKDTPGPEPKEFTECHPWKDNACCAHGTVETAQKLKEGYGAGFHWDRCGPLTPECERFFVQEACFYECDPNAGLYRKWNATVYDPRCDAYAEGYDEAHAKANGCSHNAWQMHKMPIKASYCDAWFTACAHDRFCAADGGDFFTCANAYEAVDQASLAAEAQAKLNTSLVDLEKSELERDRLAVQVESLKENEGHTGLEPGVRILIIALALAIGLAFCGVGFLIWMEKRGKPVFGRLLDEDVKVGGTTIGNAA